MTDGAKLLEISAHVERTVLSAYSYDRRFRDGWTPEADLFAFGPHRAVVAVLLHLRALGTDPSTDAVTLELHRADKLEQFAGGHEGVTDLFDGTPATADPWAEVRRLRELKALRALRQSLRDALREAETTCDLSAVRALTSEAVAGSYVGDSHGARGLQTALHAAYREATDPTTHHRGLHVGLPRIDAATGGIRRPDVWAVVALSNFGKSAFLLNIADRAVAAGIRPLIVHGEDPEGLYARRWLSRRTGVAAYRFRDHQLESEDMRAAASVVEHMPDWPCFLNGIGRSCESLGGDIRSIVASDGIGIVLVDYLQCFRVETKIEANQTVRIAHIARTFTSAIKQSGAAGVLFSQGTEEQGGRIHARYADEIRQGCEVMLVGYTQTERTVGTDETVERKYFDADKVKDGAKGFRVELDWEPHLVSFQRDDRIYRRSDDERFAD